MNMDRNKYHEIKQWQDSKFGMLPPHHQAYFTAELKRTRIPLIKNAIEIGFGTGTFLRYCLDEGIRCQGEKLTIT